MSYALTAVGRLRAVLVGLAVTVLMGLVIVATAPADAAYNEADLTIRGGDAAAFSVCINTAKAKAKTIQRTGRDNPQRNHCDNLADALGGDVELTEVDVDIRQSGRPAAGGNSLDLTIRGGDAIAVAACVNVAQGTYDNEQVNKCVNTAVATGGNVTLTNVDITVHQ